MAYLVASLIVGLGLLVGGLVHVSHPEQVARQFAPLPSALSSPPSVVGRITGIVDCKWANVGLWVRSEHQEEKQISNLNPKSQISRLSRATIRPLPRSDGNHLRRRGQSHLAGAGHL